MDFITSKVINRFFNFELLNFFGGFAMFLRKRPKPEWSLADRERERMLLDYFDAETQLEKRAERVIVCRGVIDLYPSGPDRDRAVKDCEVARNFMLYAADRVDVLRKQMIDYIAEHENDFVVTAKWISPLDDAPSHTIIERVYRDFFKARR